MFRICWIVLLGPPVPPASNIIRNMATAQTWLSKSRCAFSCAALQVSGVQGSFPNCVIALGNSLYNITLPKTLIFPSSISEPPNTHLHLQTILQFFHDLRHVGICLGEPTMGCCRNKALSSASKELKGACWRRCPLASPSFQNLRETRVTC